MISQKQISSWLPTAIELFNHYMPGLDTDAIQFQIASPKTAEKTRARIVEELGRCQDDGSTQTSSTTSTTTAMLEFLFGPNGTAVLIKQQYIKDERQFQEMLWHELGHAYAYHYEYPDVHLSDTTMELWKHADFSFGYNFWKEYIAESISCFVSSKVYSDGISDGIDSTDNTDNTDSMAEDWYPHRNNLKYYLDMALKYHTDRIDSVALAMYFAHMLMGAGEKQFFDKAVNGGLRMGTPNDYHPSSPGEIDAYCLDQEEYREALINMRELLMTQMKKPDFWLVTPGLISDCGNVITTMLLKKVLSRMRKR